MIVLYAIALYLAIGFISALAFVSVGVTQVTSYSLTLGARILLLPGATVFWPYILARWLKSPHSP
jgi:hypothetical protein